MQYLESLDIRLLLFLNGFHNDFFDVFFSFITATVPWIPLYLLLIALFVFKKKENRWKRLLILIIGVALLVASTDMLSARFFKPVFERLRPCHDPRLEGLVHIVDGHCGGMYGFISSHAANLFGIATFMCLLLRDKYRYTWLLFIWAAVIGYSRIYLGVHFPGDVICGAVVGLLLGWLWAKFTMMLESKFNV